MKVTFFSFSRQLINLIVGSLVFASSVANATSALTFQGRITNSSGQPVESSSVDITVEIRSPNSEDCLLYRETHNLDMSNSSGVFSIQIGTGVRASAAIDGGFSLGRIFSNKPSAISPLPNCSFGSSYTPNAVDTRKLKVSFNAGTGAQTIQAQEISFVPYSIESTQIGGFGADALMRVEGGTIAPFTPSQALELSNLAAGTSTLYSPANSLGGAALPSLGTLSAGQSVRWNGTSWEAFTPSAIGSALTSAVSVSPSLSVSQLAGVLTLTVNTGTTAGTVAAGNDSRLVNSIQTTTSMSGDLSGNLPSPTVVGLAGRSLATSVPALGSILRWSQNLSRWQPEALPNCAINETMYFNSATDVFACQQISVNANQITAGTLSVTRGGTGQSTFTNGQLLIGKTDGSLAKATLTAGTNVSITNGDGAITINVAGAAPTGSAGGDLTGTYPNPTLSSTGVTAGTYPKVTVDAKGRVTAGASLVSADIPALDWSKITTGKPTTLAGYGITDGATSTLASGNIFVGNVSNVATPVTVSGDATLSNSGALTLATSGVTAGTYPKVTVDTKGRVTAGASLVAADIPALDWSKITTGKPTTLAGYGITDAASTSALSNYVPLAGGTMTGNLRLNSQRELQLADTDSSNYISLRSPSAVASNVIFTLPAADGTVGQVLRTDGAGNLSWVSAATGSVTSVATGTGLTGGPITNSGTISLANTAVTPGTYGTATQVGTFNVDAQGRLIAASNITVTPAWSSITSTPTTLAGYGITDAVSTSLTSARIMVGNASNVATPVLVSGDATLSNTGALTLTTSGVTAGTYPKVTVDAKGRVTAGASLVASDIPALDWSKITTGKPTTLAGYGITDAASSTLTNGNIFVGNGSNVATPVVMSGDATLSNTGALTLATSGVTAGTYPKVTVDAKGRVTAGASLVAADIPALDVSKLTSGILSVARGGTGQGSFTNGQLLIGKTDGTLAKATLTAGTNVSITNGDGAITIDVAGAAPTGTAGGVLSGTYPNPGFATGGVTSTSILDGTIVNADISASAAIVDTKLATISTAGKVSGGAITSGTIGGSTAITTSGNIQTSGRMIASATSATTAAVEVEGQILSRVFNAGSATSINWDNGNLQYTTASCGAFTFSNMHDGGSYTLVVRGATSGTCTFSQASPAAIAAGNFKFVPANAPTVASKETVYTFLRAGTFVYVTWITGF